VTIVIAEQFSDFEYLYIWTILIRQYKKWIKQIISLYINVADPAVFILAGTLPIEAEMHIKAITLYGNITRAKKYSCDVPYIIGS
jgi:hypothetical protein